MSVGQAIQFSPGPNVCITFDDGCETDFLVAAPILRQVTFNATFFITCGRLGTTGYLSPAQLKELSREGFEVGCHSMNHPYLTDLDERALRHELIEPKAQLEQITGQPVVHFSCPGGRCNQRVIDVARGAGYRSLATSRIQANSKSTDVFSLGRVAILRDTSLSDFAAICEGRALPRMRAASALRQAVKQVIGNSMYDRCRAALLHDQDPAR